MCCVYVTGIAYTQECTMCRAGTVSKEPGMTSCEECPKDHYAPKGSAECLACNSNEYSSKFWEWLLSFSAILVYFQKYVVSMTLNHTTFASLTKCC